MVYADVASTGCAVAVLLAGMGSGGSLHVRVLRGSQYLCFDILDLNVIRAILNCRHIMGAIVSLFTFVIIEWKKGVGN